MSRDLRNDFLNEVKLAVMEFDQSETIYSRISILLEKYELSERVTDLVPAEDGNVELIKLYSSSLLIDGKAKSTVEFYIYELKRFAVSIGKSCKDVGTFEVRNYLAKRKLDGVSNRTLDTTRTVISAFYGWLAAEELIPKNPCATIKPIKYSREEKIPFSSVDLDKLRSACKNVKERSMVEFLLSSGVRVSELCDLDVQDINFTTRRVHVRHGKGDKERYTYITELAMEHLVQYLDGRTEGALFIPQRGDRYQKGGIRYIMREIGKRCGVTDVHPHRFRRTFATQLAARGMQLQEIQKLMGHSNINTTMVYITLSDADINHSYSKFA